MKTFTQKLCIFMEKAEHAEKGYRLKVYADQQKWLASKDAILLATKEIAFEVDVPNQNELIKLAIETYELRITSVRCEAEKEVQELQKKINEISLLEFKEI